MIFNNILFTPLEQFQTSVVYPFSLFFFDISVTNFSVTVCLFVFLVWVVTTLGLLENFSIYNPIVKSYILISFYSFVSSVLIQQSGIKSRPYISFALAIFSIVLCSNFSGPTVVGFTLTAQLTVTVGLALSLNIGLCLLGFYLHGLRFFKFFVPSGIPVLLIPFTTVIEVFSYSIRSVSLSVRLFANMMAGHTSSHIIGSFFVTLFWTYSNYYLASLAFILLFAIAVLEIVIAFLQAYIFLILFRTYLNDSLTGGSH